MFCRLLLILGLFFILCVLTHYLADHIDGLRIGLKKPIYLAHLLSLDHLELLFSQVLSMELIKLDDALLVNDGKLHFNGACLRLKYFFFLNLKVLDLRIY